MADYLDDDNLWKEDLYATLGVSQDATDAEIKKSYLKLAKKYHPDRFVEDNKEKLEAQRLFSKITVAYNVLSDPQKRNHYLDLRRLLADHLPEDQKAPASKSLEPNPEPAPAASPSSAPVHEKAPDPKTQIPKEDASKVAEKVKEEQSRSFFNKAMENMKKKKDDKAIEFFKQAISIKGDVAEYHSQLGMAYKNKNWEGMANAEFKLALKYDPKDRIAKNNLPNGGVTPKKADTEKKGLFGGLFNFGKKK